jgi:hypothetical protein
MTVIRIKKCEGVISVNRSNPIPNLSVFKRKLHLLAWLVLVTLFVVPLSGVPSAQAQGVGNSPTIEALPSSFLDVPNPGSASISGVIGDPTDPAATTGIDFEILDVETGPDALQVTASSDDPAIATPNLSYNGGNQWNLTITPVDVGYATITVEVADTDGNVDTYTIDYAASAASANPTTTRFHTWASDASAAIRVDENYMLVADNEDEVIRLYDRQQSGLPINKFDFTTDLNLNDNREVDLEASTRVDDRIYWLGSHSNNNDGKIRESRYRLFATDLTGSGENITLSFVGYYAGLRADLIQWDQNDRHGKGANYYGLEASAAEGIGPEASDGNGFNIEGLALAPDSTTTAYVAFRAPIVPPGDRTKALIVPVTNLPSLVSGNPSVGPAEFGAPIELDLGECGIRSIGRNDNNEYLIIAGPAPDGGGNTGCSGFSLYTWTGDPVDAPQPLPTDLAALQTRGSFEAIVDLPTPLPLDGQGCIQLVIDNGGTPWYNDGIRSKDLTEKNYQKFRSEQVLLSIAEPPTEIVVANTNDSGEGSLRQAIADIACGGTITFDPDLAGGTIILTGGSLTIGKDMTIDASAAPGLAISGDNASQVFFVESGVTAMMRNLTIRDGNTLDFGGGISNAGDLTIINGIIADNNAEGSGGGIDNEGTLTIINSGLYNNTSNSFGGAIANSGGVVTILNSTLSGNNANGGDPGSDGGGAINQFSDSSAMNITHSTITNNSAPNVAGRDGIWLEDGSLTVRHSIVAGNGADGNGANCTIDGGTFTPTGENIDDDASCTGFSKQNTDPQLDPLADNGGPSLTHALLSGSPAIDAVPVNECNDVTTDQRGVVRPQGPACDIGAFEFEAANGNTSPVADDQTISTTQDQPTSITLTASDVDGDPLDYTVVSNPVHGTLSGTAPNLTYTPDPGYTGSDSFQFVADDGQADSNTATITIAILATTSSKAIYLPLIMKPPKPPTTLVPFGGVWKYLDNGSNQGTAWREISFDDGSWSEGQAQLGYGDGDEATEVGYGPDANNKYITTYFRHTFTVNNPSAYKMLDLQLLRDDGAVVYLNNQEVFRSNMPAGEVTYTTPASAGVAGAEENAWRHQTVSPSLLVPGPNVLAVEIHQVRSSSSDISFDLELVGMHSEEIRFAVIGDYGIAGQAEAGVANLVKSWNPDFVITVGDNNYPVGAQATIVANIDQYYGEFLTANRFFPSLGNHDWISITCNTSNDCSGPYLDHFDLPGNERYYDFAKGNVHFFVIDSDPHEPDIQDGQNSIQANWLHDRLAGATEPWKIVYFHHAPYSSANHGSDVRMQWPYADWGASAVLAGHDHSYERLEIGGFPYFVNGLGGAARYTCKSPGIAGSQKCFDDDYGAMLVEADDCHLTFSFITRAHTVVDTFTLTNNCQQ